MNIPEKKWNRFLMLKPWRIDLSNVHQMTKNIFLALLILLTSLNSNAQTPLDNTQFQIEIYEELKKHDFVKLNRVTKQSELSACEIEFRYSYRDIRTRKGATVLLTGHFSSSWTPGKLPFFSFKINADEVNLKDLKWSTTAPSFINVTINKISFKPYKVADFICETGGRCVAFADSNLKINMAVAEVDPFDALLTWSFTEGGLDSSANLSEVGDRRQTQKALEDFDSCNLEINQKVAEFLSTTGK